MQLFVSHVHEEAPIAFAVKAELARAFGNQVQVFLAGEIALGTNWLAEIQQALTNSQIVIVLFSHSSSTRPWINIEAGYGVMAGKQVLPLCHSGFTKTDLPVIYGLLQAMEISDAGDVGRFFDQIARKTAAGVLLKDRSECVAHWLEAIAAARKLAPLTHRISDDAPCVWIVGSNRGLDKQQTYINEKFAGFLAHAMAEQRFRVVLGRSSLLDQLSSSLAEVQLEMLSQFGNAAAMRKNAEKPPPNPVVILGSMRASRGVRGVFMETIGRVPDVLISIGGSPAGRTPEEVAAAKSAGLPVLPIAFTGGFSAQAEHTFSESLNDKLAQVLERRRDYAAAASEICELIRLQANLAI
jgi:hypothetical protein